MFDVSAFLAAIDKYENIVIAGHVSPDGDAVGACFAMALFAAARGKKPAVLLGAYPDSYNCLAGHEFLWQGSWDDVPCELFIALDCGGKDRLGAAVSVFDRAALTVNIDHHQSNDGFANLNAVDIHKSSASELLYTILREIAPTGLDMHIASALFAGIAFDTGGFRHSSTRPETFEAAATLMRMGTNAAEIQRQILYTHSVNAAQIFGIALQHMQISSNAPIAYTMITKEEMEAAGAASHDLDGIVDHVLDTEGAKAAILLSEREGGVCKISLRSRELDMNAIAAKFGGGGHRKAAGAAINGAPKEALAQVLAECEKEWKTYEIQNKRD